MSAFEDWVSDAVDSQRECRRPNLGAASMEVLCEKHPGIATEAVARGLDPTHDSTRTGKLLKFVWKSLDG